MSTVARILHRPRPPAELVSIDGLTAPDTFVPAPELLDWIRSAYVDPDGPLYSPDHAHLEHAHIGVLWTTAENTRQGRRIVGQAEMPGRANKGGKWQKARAEQQLREWFEVEPDFLLTFDAVYADECDDRAWCCLVEHEIRHCAQAEDEFGMPRFDKVTGQPVFTLRGHDIEAHIRDVARYGAEALGDEAVDFVIAAASHPEITDTQIAMACGGKAVRQVVAA